MIRLGIIGVGGYGRWHVEAFLGLQAEGLVRITAIADLSQGALDFAAGLPGMEGVQKFTHYEELLAVRELDAVVIVAPIPFHREVTLAALARGLYVLLEKPPVPILSQLDELIAADTGGRVMVAFQHMYLDVIRNLKRDLISGVIGDLVSISAQGVWPRGTNYYQRAGWAARLDWRGLPVFDGPCTNAFAHFTNVCTWLPGSEAATGALPATLAGELYRARPAIQSYDTGCLSGTFENGVRFFMAFSHASSVRTSVEVCLRGTQGTLYLDDDCHTLRGPEGEICKGKDESDVMRRDFLAFAAGDSSRNLTPLPSMRPYVLATNMMFLASGEIHTIPAEFVRAVDPETDHTTYEVENIANLFSRCAENLTPLSGAGVPWAKQATAISATSYSDRELLSKFTPELLKSSAAG